MLRSVLTSGVSWRALMAPETETGAGVGEGDAGGLPPGGVEGGDEGGAVDDGGDRIGRRAAPDQRRGQTERRSIRENLEAGFEEARAPAKDRKTGRFAARGARGQEDTGTEQESAPETNAEVGQAEGVEGEGTATAEPALAAPAGWPKEAKAEWAKLPPVVQAAAVKREADVQKGVDELKSRYADIDSAIQPHIDSIRRHGHTPAQAVNQLFSWFQALAQNPVQAFPALAKSFGYDLAAFSQAGAPQAQQQPQVAAGEAQPETGDAIPPAVQRYIDSMLSQVGGAFNQYGQKLSMMEQQYQQANEAKTQEVLGAWSKDKPYFDRVRQTMAQLIQSETVPLKEGRVDLDGAYAKAVRLHDDVFDEMQAKTAADKAAALKADQERKLAAQATKVTDARRANVSLSPTAPGTDPTKAAQGRRKKGMSVRESLMAAKEELSA